MDITVIGGGMTLYGPPRPCQECWEVSAQKVLAYYLVRFGEIEIALCLGHCRELETRLIRAHT